MSRRTASPRRPHSCRRRTTGRTAVTSIAVRVAPAPIRAGHWSHRTMSPGVLGAWAKGDRMEMRGVIIVLASLIGLGGVYATPARAETTVADRAILAAERSLQRNPYDGTAYYRLRDAYIHKARGAGGPADFGPAQGALRDGLAPG